MTKIKYKFKTLDDFLISTPLTVDGSLDDGWGASFPVKGREIEAAILFADMAGFSRRTQTLSPTETLIFVNHFFSWITAEAIKDKPCIIDKYIGDEIMVLFSKEFGSEDPFIDAVQTGRWMAEYDAFSFCPHIGIACGLVVVGFAGTPLRYNCSVFGNAVTLASRCTSVKPEILGKIEDELYSTSIVFPSDHWKNYVFSEIFPESELEGPNGEIIKKPHAWELQEQRVVNLKNIGEIQIREIINKAMHFPSNPPENWAKQALRLLKENGFYRGS